MPFTRTLMDDEEWSVPLKDSTPRSVLREIDLRTYAHASIVITDQHFTDGTLTDADLLNRAVYVGRYMEQTDNLRTLAGDGLLGWLGDDGDDGHLYTGASGTSTNVDLEAQLENRIFTSFANGLTEGAVDADATTRQIKLEPGTSRRQFLDTIINLYPNTDWEYRVNTDGSIDVDDAATLWPTNTTPTVVLTQEGGREGAITGLRADIELDAVDVWDYRTKIVARWNTTASDNGEATNTPTSTWVSFSGGSFTRTSLIDYDAKPQPRERRRWSIRRNAANYAAWAVNSVTQATRLATRYAGQVNSYDLTLTARIDEYNPRRFIDAGDKVYVYDLDLDLTNTANEVYYRGQVIHPTAIRVQRITCPVQQGMGVYLRRWTGAAFDYYDLTDHVEFEEDETVIELGTRRRFTPRRPRPRKINKRAIRAKYRQLYRVTQYVNSQR